MEALRKTSRAVAPFGLTVLRVVVGLVMAAHGWMKLSDYSAWRESVANMGLPAPDVLAALSTAAELGGGIGLMLGLLTPIAALGILANMLVAIFKVHFDNGLMAQQGGFEYPLVLAAASLFFVLRGAGPFSLDRAFFGRKRRPEERERAYARYDREVPIT